MKYFDHIIKEGNLNVFLLNFKDAIDKLKYIRFSEHYIEFPDLVIFSTKNETIRQFLNPNIDILSVSQDDLDMMISEIKLKETSIIIDTFLKPKGFVYLNLLKLRQDLIFYKEGSYFIIVDDVLFTIDSLEFHGSFFGGKAKNFLVSQDELTYLKEFFNKSIK